ncbi:serine/threonine-protein phosphatase 7 long form homolog [Nicotiana tomentosiformis]|uniref:Serine/threonine-protein phosphatase 7 long form homolog n=1 Tax=Nicotiana tabacum TaxID=4097 RepID=A0A1S4BT63_TOBAC|nr:serine/threonine-protein phosphatase 7 long form homolog [Nicotiana tomentosiformis]XP_016492076.1 PREDICTED: serine/threonine-protein phosphatase 7 long form homolog [Nicotiana tabacum]
MDRPAFHPGPVSRELLTLQAGHRPSHIWDGELLSQNFHPRHIDDFWEFIRDNPLHHRTVVCLTQAGFYQVVEVGRLQFNWPLIMALIERWRPETHTFYLPTGDATITLQDVEVLFGLPADSLVVHYPLAVREYRKHDYLEMLERLTGFLPAEETAISGFSQL